ARSAAQLVWTPQHSPRADSAITGPMPPAACAEEVRQGDEDDERGPEYEGQRISAGMLPLLLSLGRRGHILLSFLRREAHLLDDRVCAGFDTTAIIGRVLLEVRDDRFADDDAGHRVGH